MISVAPCCLSNDRSGCFDLCFGFVLSAGNELLKLAKLVQYRTRTNA